MTKDEVMTQLKKLGNANTKKVFLKHGAREPFYGVKVGDMKPIQKIIKKDYELSKQLYDTGITDAMYFAGLIADEKKMTKTDLNKWLKGAYWYMICEYTVPWIASESKHGYELGLKWIESKNEREASAGWATLSNWISLRDSAELDLKTISKLLKRIEKEIHNADNRVRYTMNGFVISVGCYIHELTKDAEKTAKAIGKVQVDMGGTACKVPLATEYIAKVKKMGRIGKKKKEARC